jgi:hypothetical protein
MKHFETLDNLENRYSGLKREYRNNEIALKQVNSEYLELTSRIDIIVNNEDITDLQKDLALAVIFFEGLNIEIMGSWVWLEGNTKEHKDSIKELGYMFSGKHKKWFSNPAMRKSRPSKKTYQDIKDTYGKRLLALQA